MSSQDPVNHQDALFAATTSRRQLLGTAGLAGLGWLASSAITSAASSRSSQPLPKVVVSTPMSNAPSMGSNRLPAFDVPDEWLESNRSAQSYQRYLHSLKLGRVSPEQVIESHAKSHRGVWNTLPPNKWWNRMGYILKVADRIALEMNVKEVEVISAYRAPTYNAQCYGAKSGSWHQANIAVDLKFPVRASKVTSTARELRDLGLFRGGVGGYWNFTHIDARGQNVNW